MSDEQKQQMYGRVVDLLDAMEQGSAGNVSVYNNVKDLESTLRSLIYAN